MQLTNYKSGYFETFLQSVPADSVFVEIGSDRKENSTQFLTHLAEKHGVSLFSVDIENKPRYPVSGWKVYYDMVKDPTWPDASSIDDPILPAYVKQELINRGWRDGTRWPQSEQLKFFQAVGSEWAKSYAQDLKAPISLLYLDNFDYIWDIEDMPDWIKNQIDMYKNIYNIDMNNRACQIEHLTQLIYLEPWLISGALVGFDDTYPYNDCWIGKCGPGVVYLQALGYHLELFDKDSKFVLMKKP